jgi:hypothetical protein
VIGYTIVGDKIRVSSRGEYNTLRQAIRHLRDKDRISGRDVPGTCVGEICADCRKDIIGEVVRVSFPDGASYGPYCTECNENKKASGPTRKSTCKATVRHDPPFSGDTLKKSDNGQFGRSPKYDTLQYATTDREDT